jgi:hypothetical protein
LLGRRGGRRGGCRRGRRNSEQEHSRERPDHEHGRPHEQEVVEAVHEGGGHRLHEVRLPGHRSQAGRAHGCAEVVPLAADGRGERGFDPAFEERAKGSDADRDASETECVVDPRRHSGARRIDDAQRTRCERGIRDADPDAPDDEPPELSSIYRFPAYYILRKIDIGGVINNAENFLSLHWYFNTFLLITLGLYFLSKGIEDLFKVKKAKKKNIIIIVIGLLVLFLRGYVFSNSTAAIKFMKYTFPLFFSGSLLILVIIICFFILIRGNKKRLQHKAFFYTSNITVIIIGLHSVSLNKYLPTSSLTAFLILLYST